MFLKKCCGVHTLRIAVLITILIFFLLFGSASSMSNFNEKGLLDRVHISGNLEANGTHYEIKNSSHLNITVDSSEPIELTLESVPEMITMRIEPATGAASAKIILGGFLSHTTYHKYEDDYHNHTSFNADANGSYTYTQDLLNKHLVFIQPRPSTKFIKEDATGGDCTSIGTWNVSAKTCTLTTDLSETIQIDSNSITLNGDGHTIKGSHTGNGVYLSDRSGVTIKNLNVKQFYYGIHLSYSSNNTVTGNNASNNNFGIDLESASNNNTVNGNSASNNGYYGIDLSSSNNNTINGNNASENKNGGAGGTGIHLSSSNNNTLTDNNVNSNFVYYYEYGYSGSGFGISLSSSNNNMLTGNIASKNFYGIVLSDSGNNTLSSNNAWNNGHIGINLGSSRNNTLNGNKASNNYYGIGLSSSNNNTLTGNKASNNRYYGIDLINSGKNTLTNNTMNRNKYNFHVYGYSNSKSPFDNQIDVSNLVDEKPIYYIKGARDIVYDSKTNAGMFYCINCVNVTLKDLDLKNNGNGIFFWNTSHSRIQNINASNNEYYGIGLSSSYNNTLGGNKASNNGNYGISLESSSNNTLRGNKVSNNENSGILLAGSSKNTLSGNNASNNSVGFYLSYSRNNMLRGNNAMKNGNGISLAGSSKNTLSGNNALNNGVGIYLISSRNNMLGGNNASNNSYDGIYLQSSSKNTLTNNTMNGNKYNFHVFVYFNSKSHFDNQIDTSNLVDEKPVYYIKGARDTVYDSKTNAGTFYCINCLNVTLKDLDLKNNGNGIFFWNTSHSRIQNVSASNNGYYGIGLSSSNNNTLTGNNASNNENSGISLFSSSNNTLTVNTANSNNGVGISLSSSNNNMLSGNKASKNYLGISLYDSRSNTLRGNNASNNGYYGIILYSSSKNTFTNNTMNGNKYNFHVYQYSNSKSFFDNQIDTSNLVDEKPVYYIKGVRDTVYDSYTNAGTFYCINCVNVTLKDLDLKNNGNGIFFLNTSRSRIQNINSSNNEYGIGLSSSNNNTLEGNNASNNSNYGISLSSSRSNALTGNNASNNYYSPGIGLYSSSNNTLGENIALNNPYGISLESSGNNTLSGNKASNNSNYGISVYDSSNNKIYNNIFNNTENFYSYNSNINTWNTSRRSGTNIIAGSFLGGNFWANPEGTGFSQTCKEANGDGICDKSYSLDENNIDYLPLSKDKIPPKSVSNLKNVSYASSYMNWTWKDPMDIDFKKVIVFIDGKFKKNVSKGKMYFNATNFTANTKHTISTRTVDMNGNINRTWVNHSAWTAK